MIDTTVTLCSLGGGVSKVSIFLEERALVSGVSILVSVLIGTSLTTRNQYKMTEKEQQRAPHVDN